MTKQDFFNLSVSVRKSLINRAHYYYVNDIAVKWWTIPDDDADVREFIEMCFNEYEKYSKKQSILVY